MLARLPVRTNLSPRRSQLACQLHLAGLSRILVYFKPRTQGITHSKIPALIV
jgi:hypothetical protein